MAEIIHFPTPQNKSIRLNRLALERAARKVPLRPAPSEAPHEFVARIVSAYQLEVDAQP